MVNSFPEIKTSRLLLRRFTESDTKNVFKGLSHPEVIKYYGVSFKTLKETREQMQWFEQLEESGTGIWWAICSRDNTVFYGAGGLNNLSEKHKKAEAGFWLLPDFRRQGIMKEAMQPIINYGFNKLCLRRIEGFVESKNENSRSALRKIGFVYEGTMRDCEMKNGAYISLEIYAMLRSEYNL